MLHTFTDKIDPALARIAAAIEPQSSVPLSVQLRGALEYGIATGEIPANTRLPSVRRLAASLRISPVTVSNVYAALQERGHVEGRVGSGTFVTDRAAPTASQTNLLAAFERQIVELLQTGRELGLSRQDIAFRITMAPPSIPVPLRIIVVGTFIEATRAYAADLSPYLPEGDSVTAANLEDLTEPPQADLIVCPHTLAADAARRFPGIPVLGMTLIPNEQTRIALAGIGPEARVGVVSYFDDFLPTLKSGIDRFAPHLGRITAVPRSDAALPKLLEEIDVLIYATGAEYLRQRLRPDQAAIEYRHTPDSHALQSKLLPAINNVRTGIPAQETQDEHQ